MEHDVGGVSSEWTIQEPEAWVSSRGITSLMEKVTLC